MASPVPVPKVLWRGRDPAVLGAPFFVMERVEGVVPTGKPSIHLVGWLSTLTVNERARLWAAALDVLVAVHAVEWRATHRFLVTDQPEGSSVAGHVTRLTEWYRWATQGRSYPITDAAAAYLEDRAGSVASAEDVLLWGDPRVGNMVFGDDLVPAAALDWETASIGPAERDVAHWLFFDEFGTDAVGIDRLPGWPDREATVSRYEERSGRRLGDLAFFDVLQALFVATTLIRQADARVAAGLAPPGTRMGHAQHGHPDARPPARATGARTLAGLPGAPGPAVAGHQRSPAETKSWRPCPEDLGVHPGAQLRRVPVGAVVVDRDRLGPSLHQVDLRCAWPGCTGR